MAPKRKGKPSRKTSARKRRAKQRKRQQRPLLIQARSLKRKRKAKLRRARASSKSWWDWWPLEFVALEQNFPPEYQGEFTRRIVGKALVYTGLVEVPHTGHIRQIALVFPGRPSQVRPFVMADGPRTKRHRFNTYRPQPLCIWYGPDPQKMRWTVNDGLVGLIDLTRHHLAKEAWFRATGVWPGEEVHLQPELRAGGRVSPRKKPKAAIRRQRQKCWCGKGRYRGCHGAIDRDEELSQLGID